jgi:hypothetical protein
MRGRATSLGATFGYEMAGRIGEYTHNERNQINHCVRVDDFTFAVEVEDTINNIPGSGLTDLKFGRGQAVNFGVQSPRRYIEGQGRGQTQADRASFSGGRHIPRRLGLMASPQWDYREGRAVQFPKA